MGTPRVTQTAVRGAVLERAKERPARGLWWRTVVAGCTGEPAPDLAHRKGWRVPDVLIGNTASILPRRLQSAEACASYCADIGKHLRNSAKLSRCMG